MKCQKCKSKNVFKASYCQKCGKKFTDEEKKSAYRKTIFGKIDSILQIKSIVSLNIITGNIFFKIASLLIVLGIGLYFLFTMGIHTKILNSKEYDIIYHKKNNEYYLLIDDKKDSVELNLYRPNRIKEMIIYTYNLEDSEQNKIKISRNDKITLPINQDDYHMIESKYSNKKKDQLKLYVYHKSDIKE